jgi:hypothetical protein
MPLPPPGPTTPSSSRIHDPHARVHVLRIRVGGVDHLFFGPAIDIEGEMQEIEFLGVTDKGTLIKALSSKTTESGLQ